MHHIYQTEAIVIAGSPRGDASKRVTVLSRDLGVIHAGVQNIRSLSSKLRYSVQDLSFSHISFVRGKGEWKITGASVEKNFFYMFKESPDKLQSLARILNLIKRVVGEGEEPYKVFEIINSFVLFLENSSVEIQTSEHLTLLRLLSVLGFLRETPYLKDIIQTHSFESEELQIVSQNKKSVVALINEALQAAQQGLA